MSNDLYMKDPNAVYLAGPRGNFNKFPHEFFIYSLDEDRFSDVLEWCLDSLSGRWTYCFIEDYATISGHDDPYAPDGETLADRLAFASEGMYGRHLRLTFELEQDAVLFKIRWK